MPVLIFTDLDGTLLDHDTYSWDEAIPALNLCRRLDYPLIMVSSKTRAELDVLRQEIGLSSPFVSENGGGIFFPEEGIRHIPPGPFSPNSSIWSIGTPYHVLIRSLREIREA